MRVLIVIFIFVAATGCRLFSDANSSSANNENNANNANNVNNTTADMGTDQSMLDMDREIGVPTEQPTLQPLERNEGRIEDGRLFEFRFTEATGNETRSESGDFVLEFFGTVERIEERNGIRMDGQSRVSSTVPITSFYNAVLRREQFTIEAFVRAGNDSQGGPSRIVSFSRNTSQSNLQLGQEDTAWAIRQRHSVTRINQNLYGNPQVRTGPILDLNETHLVYTYDGVNGRLYVNGALAQRDTRAGSVTNWDPTFLLHLGNEATDDRGWAGEIYLVAGYDRVLSLPEIITNYTTGSTF